MGSHSLKETIQNVVKGYHDLTIQEFLEKNHRRSITYRDRLTIEESIERIVKAALSHTQNNLPSSVQEMQKGDTFIFGDVHGRLDIFVQNLYVSGMIDNQGNWAGGNKSAIVLGDLINRGPYSVETLLYVMALQKQAEKKGGRFKVLFGNHEHLLLNGSSINFYNIHHKDTVAKILKHHIKTGEITLAFADNKKNILCIHAGLEKALLIRALELASSDAKKDLLALGNIKIDSKQIYQIMEKYAISPESLARVMNHEFKKDTSMHAPFLTPRRPVQGIINSRKKNTKPDYEVARHHTYNKSYKMTQLVGHTTTNNMQSKNSTTLPYSKSFGAYRRINNKFYLDNDMLRGNLAFAVIKNNVLYQVMSPEKGLKTSSNDTQNRWIFDSGVFYKGTQKLSTTYNYLNNEPYGSYAISPNPLNLAPWKVTEMKVLGKKSIENPPSNWENISNKSMALQKKQLSDVLNAYNIDFLNAPMIRTKIIENIQQFIQEALEGTMKNREKINASTIAFKDCDTVVLGDVHGQFKLMVQNLYLAGIIDESGNYNQHHPKNFLQLGDICERGPHVLECMIYLRMLQNQARMMGKEIHLLFGNHEKYQFRDQNGTSDKFNHQHIKSALRQIITEDILKDRMKLVHADDTLRVLFSHGSISKSIIAKIVLAMNEDTMYRSKLLTHPNLLLQLRKLSEKKDERVKLQLKDIYQVLDACGIRLSDLATWMNQHLKEKIRYTKSTGYQYDRFKQDFLISEDDGVYGRKKAISSLRKKRNAVDYLITMNGNHPVQNKYFWKPRQIGGHTAVYKANGYGVGIKQNRANFFVDSGLYHGNQALLGINQKTGHMKSLELLDYTQTKLMKGYDVNKKVIPLMDKMKNIKILELNGGHPISDRVHSTPLHKNLKIEDCEMPMEVEYAQEFRENPHATDETPHTPREDPHAPLEKSIITYENQSNRLSDEMRHITKNTATLKCTAYFGEKVGQTINVNISNGKIYQRADELDMKPGTWVLFGTAAKEFNRSIQDLSHRSTADYYVLANEIGNNPEFLHHTYLINNENACTVLSKVKAYELKCALERSAKKSAEQTKLFGKTDATLMNYKHEKAQFLMNMSLAFTTGNQKGVNNLQDLQRNAHTYIQRRDNLRKKYIPVMDTSKSRHLLKLENWIRQMNKREHGIH